VNPLGRDAGGEQRRLGLVVDAVRAAHEGVVDVVGVDERAEELADLGAAEAPVVERQVGRLLREHHVQRQARQVAVLEVLELLGEHRRALPAVAVDQREARLRLGREHRLHDRQDRRDAAAAGDAEVVARAVASSGTKKRPSGVITCSVSPTLSDSSAHDENTPPGTLRMPTRSSPSAGPGADRVRAALLAAGDGLLQRQVLALGEAELLASSAGTSNETTTASSVSGRTLLTRSGWKWSATARPRSP
jgi:hypothetical protein